MLKLANTIQNSFQSNIHNNIKDIYKIFKSNSQLANDKPLIQQIANEMNNITQHLIKFFMDIVTNIINNVKVVNAYFASNENHIASENYQNKIRQLCNLFKTLDIYT